MSLRRLMAACVLALCCWWSTPAMADAVDDAFVRGNALARDGDWEGAVGEYEQARRLLPGRSALLSYNLGTAYAQLGETGRAVFHLRRALQAQAEPSDEIVEAARRNLGILQRRAEIDATAEGAQISPPEDWWDRAVSALAAPLLGWLTLVSGWCALAFVVVRTSRARRGKNTALSGALALVLCVAFLLGALVHGVALRANHSFPRAIALEQKLEVREGPGNHRKVSFVLQGGSRVRIVDASPGWSKIRLEGGLEGWVTERSLGRLGTADSIPAPAPARAKAASAT